MDCKKNVFSKQKENDYDYFSDAISSQDATGLIPANPSLNNTDSYNELYHYKPQKNKPQSN